MALFTLIKQPNPLLREISKPVEYIDDEFKEFMHSLLETMYHENGIGMAAVQVGNPVRACVIDIPAAEAIDHNDPDIIRDPLFIINPKISYLSYEMIVLNEGCLSVRGKDDETWIEGNVL